MALSEEEQKQIAREYRQQKTDEQNYDSSSESSNTTSKNKDIRKGVAELKNVLSSAKEIGIVGSILMTGVAVFAVFIDILPFVTGDLSSMIDWILDILFFIALFFVTAIITGDIIGSMVGKKSMVNTIQTIAEFIPLIDVIPFHTLAVIIITLDIKYNILSFTKLKNNNTTDFPQKNDEGQKNELDKAA